MRRLSKMPADANEAAALTVKLVTGETNERDERSPISCYLAEIGSKGGKKGGKARARALSSERRKEIATAAAKKRWEAKRGPE